MTALDLDAIASEFLQQCGLHDAGISATCACAERDYRPTMLALVREVEQLRTVNRTVNAELLRHANVLGASVTDLHGAGGAA